MALVSREWLEPAWAAAKAGELPTWADFEWYAVDDAGSVGMFTSAGPGPIPRAVFRDLETHLAVAGFLDRLPVRGAPELLIHYPRVIDYTRAAERGLFAFDYVYASDWPADDGYRLVAGPPTPLSLDALPSWVRDWLGGILLPGAMFAESRASVLDLSVLRLDLVV